MRRAIILGFVVFAALFVASSVTAGQRGKGPYTLTGLVLGPDDKPVANASISYQSSGGNAPHATRTDAKGHFRITGLRADDYDIRASAKGVFSEWEKNVAVGRGQVKDVTLRLIYAKEMPKAWVGKKPKP
jgi:hypothetical protein